MSTVVLHDQRILVGDPSGRPGDCLRAAVATMLQTDPDRVPHFLESVDWMGAVLAYRPDLQFRRRTDPVEVMGHLIEPQPLFPACGSARPWVVGVGMSPRGVHHAVVLAARDGSLIHDPHPSRDGLSGPVEILIVSLSGQDG